MTSYDARVDMQTLKNLMSAIAADKSVRSLDDLIASPAFIEAQRMVDLTESYAANSSGRDDPPDADFDLGHWQRLDDVSIADMMCAQYQSLGDLQACLVLPSIVAACLADLKNATESQINDFETFKNELPDNPFEAFIALIAAIGYKAAAAALLNALRLARGTSPIIAQTPSKREVMVA